MGGNLRYLLLSCLLLLLAIASTKTKVIVDRGIVDGGGYEIRNAAYNDSLLMDAQAPLEGHLLGRVILTPISGSRSQKWGVEYFGGTTAALTPGANRVNSITSYFTPRWSKPLARGFTFETCEGLNRVKIRNVEEDKCLSVFPLGMELIVELADCDSDNASLRWIFFRYG